MGSSRRRAWTLSASSHLAEHVAFEHARAEFGRLVRLAAPIILAQLSQMGQGVADAVMAGRVSAADLAGVTLGGNVYWPAMMLISGMIMAVTPTVSQMHGAGRQAEAGEAVRQALWIAVSGGLLLALLMNNLEPFYYWAGVDVRAIPIAVDYLHALSFSVVQLMMFFALRYLCEGMSWTKPAMVIAMSALVAKIFLNNLFIYGGALGPFTVPAMGGVGCGWASAVVINLQLLAMAAVVAAPRIRPAGLYARFSLPDWQRIGRLVRLGFPIGVTTSLEMSLFSVVTIMIGTISVEAVAAHQIAMNVGGLAFMVPLALGMGAAIRVGYNVGADDLDGARLSAWVAVVAAALFSTFAAAAVFFGREHIAGLYTRELEVLTLSAGLMLFVAFFQLFDATQTAAIGALRGFKDTRAPALVAVGAYWLIGFPVAAVLGFGLLGVPSYGLDGFWSGLTLGLAVAACALLLRLRWLAGHVQRVREFADR